MTDIPIKQGKKRSLFRWFCGGLFAVFIIGMLLPQDHVSIPVRGATPRDWNPKSFWSEPWGASGVHKGVDIFAQKGQELIPPTYGVVLWAGEIGLGGKFVVMLGPKWQLHYLAHLDTISAYPGQLVIAAKQALGTVGNSGNAQGKAPHLHYTILTLVPYPWLADSSTQGWKKMFYLNPHTRLGKP